jgi:hypothetical protein
MDDHLTSSSKPSIRRMNCCTILNLMDSASKFEVFVSFKSSIELTLTVRIAGNYRLFLSGDCSAL